MELVVECSESALQVQAEKSPPVIDRLLDYRVDTAEPLECFRCAACIPSLTLLGQRQMRPSKPLVLQIHLHQPCRLNRCESSPSPCHACTSHASHRDKSPSAFKADRRRMLACVLPVCIIMWVALPVHRTEDNRFLGLALSKRLHGEHWRRLFRGDPDGARCLLPPYRLSGAPATLLILFYMSAQLKTSIQSHRCAVAELCHACRAESDTDVLLEVDLPFWIYPDDVSVRILPDQLHITVRNELSLTRTYWQNKCAATHSLHACK